MTGGFLDSFSGALDGVTEADVSAFDVQRGEKSVEELIPESVPAPTLPSENLQSSAPKRAVPAPIRDAANALLAGSMYTVSGVSHQRELATLWVHTAETSQQILFGEPILLGRSAPVSDTNFLRVNSDKVSREHCGVRVTDGIATCVDLGSTNGTWIDRHGAILEVSDDPIELLAGDNICTMVNRIVLAHVTTTETRP